MLDSFVRAMSIALVCAMVCGSVFAQGPAELKKAGDTPHDARLQKQAKQLQNAKLKEAHGKIRTKSEVMHKRTREIDQHLEHQHRQLDHHVDGMWQAAIDDADRQKQELTRRAAAQKHRIRQQYHDDTTRQLQAARKSVDGVNQSVVGLQSQASKDGKFGLKPQSSNLHVRHYGGK